MQKQESVKATVNEIINCGISNSYIRKISNADFFDVLYGFDNIQSRYKFNDFNWTVMFNPSGETPQDGDDIRRVCHRETLQSFTTSNTSYYAMPYLYKGDRGIKENKMACTGIQIDLDDIGEKEFINFVNLCKNGEFPAPTMISPSGSGLSLYYAFNKIISFSVGRKPKDKYIKQLVKAMYGLVISKINPNNNALHANQGIRIPGVPYKDKYNLQGSFKEAFLFLPRTNKEVKKAANFVSIYDLCNFFDITRPEQIGVFDWNYESLQKSRLEREQRKINEANKLYKKFKDGDFGNTFFDKNGELRKITNLKYSWNKRLVRLMLEFECTEMAPYIYQLSEGLSKDNYNKNITLDKVEYIIEKCKNIETSPEGKRFNTFVSLSLMFQICKIRFKGHHYVSREEALNYMNELLDVWNNKFTFSEPFTYREIELAYDGAKKACPNGTWKRFIDLCPSILKIPSPIAHKLRYPKDLIEFCAPSQTMIDKHKIRLREEVKNILKADGGAFIPQHYKWLYNSEENYNIEKGYELKEIWKRVLRGNQHISKEEFLSSYREENSSNLTDKEILYHIEDNLYNRTNKRISLIDFRSQKHKKAQVAKKILNYPGITPDGIFESLRLPKTKENIKIVQDTICQIDKILTEMPKSISEEVKRLVEIKNSIKDLKIKELPDISVFNLDVWIENRATRRMAATILSTKIDLYLIKSIISEANFGDSELSKMLKDHSSGDPYYQIFRHFLIDYRSSKWKPYIWKIIKGRGGVDINTHQFNRNAKAHITFYRLSRLIGYRLAKNIQDNKKVDWVRKIKSLDKNINNNNSWNLNNSISKPFLKNSSPLINSMFHSTMKT